MFCRLCSSSHVHGQYIVHFSLYPYHACMMVLYCVCCVLTLTKSYICALALAGCRCPQQKSGAALGGFWMWLQWCLPSHSAHLMFVPISLVYLSMYFCLLEHNLSAVPVQIFIHLQIDIWTIVLDCNALCILHLLLILLDVFVFEANRAEIVAALRWLADFKTAAC